MQFQPIWLSLELALVTTIILMIIGVPLASLLAFRSFRFKSVAEAVISLPLVLPPSVLGFYLLVIFSPHNFVGHLLQSWFNIRLVFSFPGLVVGSIIYSLPFMVHPLQAGLQSLPANLKEASYTLGKNRWQTLFGVLLPNIKPAILTGVVLTFAHTIGEFGVVLMIGGSLPGKTKVASIAIYEAVESLEYGNAHIYSIVLLLISFFILLLTYKLNKKLFKPASS
jgi:molybdate transport system permease protein